MLVANRQLLPSDVLRVQLKGAAVFVGINLLYGVGRSGIDVAAHVGGLLVGCGLGSVVLRTADRDQSKPGSRALVSLAAGAALIIATVSWLPTPEDLGPDLTKFGQIEEATLDKFNTSVSAWKSDRLSTADLLHVLEDEVLPKCSAAQETMARPRRLAESQQAIAASLGRYIETRAESWRLLATGIRQDDPNLVKRAGEKGQEADRLAKALSTHESQ